MQLLCAYELVSLGGSAFCSLFTEEEWRGFEYAHDIEFYDAYCGCPSSQIGRARAARLTVLFPGDLLAAFGQPAQAAMGKGWAQEWLARTFNQPLSDFNSTTNSTLHSEQYFPLEQNLYVDATHDTGSYLPCLALECLPVD